MESTHIGYDVPPGNDNVLLFEGAGTTVGDLRFMFGGKPGTLRIRRLVELRACEPDFIFGDASPHEATVFFARNPLAHSNSGEFRIVVDNLGESSETLQVTAIYERTNLIQRLGCFEPRF